VKILCQKLSCCMSWMSDVSFYVGLVSEQLNTVSLVLVCMYSCAAVDKISNNISRRVIPQRQLSLLLKMRSFNCHDLTLYFVKLYSFFTLTNDNSVHVSSLQFIQ